MKIEVTTEDIRSGRREDAFLCPIARAIKRRTGRTVKVNNYTWELMGKDSVYWLDGTPRKFQLTDELVAKVKTFDLSGTIEPFEFEITDEVFE